MAGRGGEIAGSYEEENKESEEESDLPRRWGRKKRSRGRAAHGGVRVVDDDCEAKCLLPFIRSSGI